MSTQLDTLRAFVAPRPAAQPPRAYAHVIAVAAGKGGTGTSTVAALLARAGARQGRETLLVDASGGPGSLYHLLGVDSSAQSAHGATIALAPGLALATADSPAGTGPGERAARYRRTAGRYADYELVIVDAGATLDGVCTAAALAGRLIVVTAADRVAIAAGYALLKVVGQRFPALPVGILANRCGDAVGAAAYDRIGAGARRFLGHLVGYAGAIPDDHQLRAATDDGRALDGAAHGPAAVAADGFMARLLDTTHDARTLSHPLSRA